MNARALSLLLCVHSFGLGYNFGNSLDQKESARALIQWSQSFQKILDNLYLTTPDFFHSYMLNNIPAASSNKHVLTTLFDHFNI